MNGGDSGMYPTHSGYAGGHEDHEDSEEYDLSSSQSRHLTYMVVTVLAATLVYSALEVALGGSAAQFEGFSWQLVLIVAPAIVIVAIGWIYLTSITQTVLLRRFSGVRVRFKFRDFDGDRQERQHRGSGSSRGRKNASAYPILPEAQGVWLTRKQLALVLLVAPALAVPVMVFGLVLSHLYAGSLLLMGITASVGGSFSFARQALWTLRLPDSVGLRLSPHKTNRVHLTGTRGTSMGL